MLWISFFALVSTTHLLGVVKGDASLYDCLEDPCIVDFEENCTHVLFSHDFEGGPCCALTDTPSGGCELTVTDECTWIERPSKHCSANPDAFPIAEEYCLASSHSTAMWLDDSTPSNSTCPESKYVALGRPSSILNNTEHVMLLVGDDMLAPLNEANLQVWADATRSHILSYHTENPQLNVNDFILQISPYNRASGTVV